MRLYSAQKMEVSMTITITPARLSGSITPPPSKSQAHRLLIAAALAQGESRITNIAFSQDILATLDCLEQLGARIAKGPDSVRILGIASQGLPDGALPHLDCRESGSTLRFMIPVALGAAGGGVFTGAGRLLERPQGPYEKLFRDKGISFVQTPQSIQVQGRLEPGEYPLAGDVSSQFITGLLYALPTLPGASDIILTTPLESKGYVDMTLLALRTFGVSVQETARGYHIPGGQQYQAASLSVESDYSQAGFYYAANGLGNQVEIQGLNPDSAQGDRCIISYYIKLCRTGTVELDVSQCPDLVPALALHAALRTGETTAITNAARLRMKESDRLAAVTQELNKLGAQVEEYSDHLVIHGVDKLSGGTVDAHNDHRIAMMLAMAATRCTAPITLTGAESVNKSYPAFWEDYAALGGLIQPQP